MAEKYDLVYPTNKGDKRYVRRDDSGRLVEPDFVIRRKDGTTVVGEVKTYKDRAARVRRALASASKKTGEFGPKRK